MDFGDVLNQWEQTGNPDFPVKDKDSERPGTGGPKATGRKQLLRSAPEAEVDLHGYSLQEAESVLHGFITECYTKGFRKVRIITGKGNHSSGTPVLGRMTQKYIEKSAVCGEFGYSDGRNGGKGALWVIIRNKG